METQQTNQDFRSYDWDDTLLIEAYDKGLKLKGKAASVSKKQVKNQSSKENSNIEDKWSVGDYCRAPYSVDGRYYEAKVRSVEGDSCAVEFLGYGDREEVELTSLRETLGKNSRKKQVRSIMKEYSLRTSDTGGETTDAPSESHASCSAKKKIHECQVSHNHLPYDCSGADSAFHMLPQAVLPCCAPPSHPHNMPFQPSPLAPPMPQCSNVANNPSLSAMLVSWYMAGYYTGLNQAQKGPSCSQRCCGHSNSCCHH